MSCLLVFVAYTLHTGFKNVTNLENFTSHTIAVQVVSVKRFVSNSKLSSFGNFKYVEQLIFARQQHTAAFKLKQQWFGSKYVWNSIVLCHLVLVFTLRGGQFAFFFNQLVSSFQFIIQTIMITKHPTSESAFLVYYPMHMWQQPFHVSKHRCPSAMLHRLSTIALFSSHRGASFLELPICSRIVRVRSIL